MPATDEYTRDVKKVHVVFALSSVVLCVSTFWMMADDHIEPWRQYQETFDKLEAEKLREKQQQVKTEDFQTAEEWQAEVESLEGEIQDLNAELQDAGTQVPELQAKLDEAIRLVDLKEREVRDERAHRDVARANYDLGIRDNLPPEKLDVLKAAFDALQATVAAHELELQKLQANRDAIAKQLAEKTRQRDEKVEHLKKLTAEVDLAHAALQKLEPESWLAAAKRTTLDWYIIDGFSPTHKIVNDWLPDLHITLGMTETARFDRCRTCHKGIDVTEAGGVPKYPFGNPESDDIDEWLRENKFPHPFATHPRPDVYVAGGSPHPAMEGALKFGCTICHDGNGSGTNFQNAEHGPNDPHQAEEWEEHYGYHANHFWEYPMQPERFIESGCIKCHHSVVELGVNPKFGATAPRVFHGYQLITEYGCFGCHEIHGFDAGEPIGPDLRLEPQTPEEADKIAADRTLVAGKMRKVGPSLEHVASKTDRGWIEFWTEEPKVFRPSTRMPQFFKLANHLDPEKLKRGEIDLEHVTIDDLDEHIVEKPDGTKVRHGAKVFVPVEIAAIAHYLIDKSQPLELSSPAADYQPNAERGRESFATRGCLACHSHREFPQTMSDFGPELSRVYAKMRSDENGFSNWMYTWIRDPERHSPRTRMPNLFLEPYQQGEEWIDPAADIVAFLMTPPANVREDVPARLADYRPLSFDSPERQAALDELLKLYLSKAIGIDPANEVLASGKYPIPADEVKGEEIEIARGLEDARADDGKVDPSEWQDIKLNYVGVRTISRYGCFGCHDIPGFRTARPIGTTLQDWGRKDRSTLALEHIEEYLHHHGEQDGSSTRRRVEEALKKMRGGGHEAGEFKSAAEQERELSAAFFYESLLHHGRAGFAWQKMRQPRSYDYMKIETKGYDERLRMPKFPFNEEDIEAIATFVLGLVAEPPPTKYLFRPEGPAYDRIEGERLIEKYNCAGCHMLELPEIRYGVDPDNLLASKLGPADHPQALDMLLKLKPPQQAETGETMSVGTEGEQEKLPEIAFRGLYAGVSDPLDPPELREYYYDNWYPFYVGEGDERKLLLPKARMIVPMPQMSAAGLEHPYGYDRPGRGGAFAEFLVDHLLQTNRADDRNKAWQMSPPPLYQEGFKVQTPWLYQFLKEPQRLRQITVLRMPRFNMTDDEARSLANYFAASDGAEYPYLEIPQRDPQYLARKDAEFHAQWNPSAGTDYAAETWKLLNAPLCLGCHSVGGRVFQKSADPKQVQGPDLEHVAQRLRPDWTLLWLYKPEWITPYTSMPPPFARNQKLYDELFGGDGEWQTIAIRDALMNYHRLMEREGPTIFTPKSATAAGGGGE